LNDREKDILNPFCDVTTEKRGEGNYYHLPGQHPQNLLLYGYIAGSKTKKNIKTV
jgi:hypothetical protein